MKFRVNFQKILKELWRKFKFEQFCQNFEEIKTKKILNYQNFFFLQKHRCYKF